MMKPLLAAAAIAFTGCGKDATRVDRESVDGVAAPIAVGAGARADAGPAGIDNWNPRDFPLDAILRKRPAQVDHALGGAVDSNAQRSWRGAPVEVDFDGGRAIAVVLHVPRTTSGNSWMRATERALPGHLQRTPRGVRVGVRTDEDAQTITVWDADAEDRRDAEADRHMGMR